MLNVKEFAGAFEERSDSGDGREGVNAKCEKNGVVASMIVKYNSSQAYRW